MLASILLFTALPFVGLTIFFGTKGGYYDSDDYNGDGCAHDVKRWKCELKQKRIITTSFGL